MYESVKEYYGKNLKHSDDLQTNACCTSVSIPTYLKSILSNVHDEVLAKYYGCGLVLPEALEGARVLDLGSGSGRDCYVLGQLVGENGEVIGVDMTDEQLQVANRHVEYHRDKFGYKNSNISFRRGYIECLEALNLDENSFDLIVSNCVINLSPEKDAVLREAYRLLKPGGEMYFSDVYADRRIPQNLAADPVLYGECLSGALYWNDFCRLARQAGFLDPRLVEDSVITIDNEDIINKIGHINFYSATYRLFKIPELESSCEDYGQAVIYNGGIAHHEQVFSLDAHHRIRKGEVFRVCGNTYRMLNQSRLQPYFTFIGSWKEHYGIYPGCGIDLPFASSDGNSSVDSNTGGGCC